MQNLPLTRTWISGRRFIGVAMLTAIMLLAACTALQLTYNNAEFAIHWKVQEYFDLQGSQEADFRARLARFHAWHRGQELPRYEALARQAGERMTDGLSADDVQWATSALRERYRVLMRRTAHDAAPVLATLSSAQLAHLEKEFARSNEKFAKKYLSGSEDKQFKERVKRTREQLQDWIGKFTPEQEARVVALVRATPSLSAYRLEDHKLQQQRFLQLLRTQRDPVQLANGLGELLENIESRRPPAYAAAMREAEPRLTRFLIDLDKTLTPEQRQYVMQRFADYARDFQALIGKGSGKGQGVPERAAIDAISG